MQLLPPSGLGDRDAQLLLEGRRGGRGGHVAITLCSWLIHGKCEVFKDFQASKIEASMVLSWLTSSMQACKHRQAQHALDT